MSTSQTFVPNDTATLAGIAAPVGNLRFKLFKTTGACDNGANGNRIPDSGDTAMSANTTYGTPNTDLLTVLNATNPT